LRDNQGFDGIGPVRRVLFASDLDNTLIHSYRVAEGRDICVETRDGKKLSFMSPEAHGILKDIAAKCTFVPVTTRSLEQYRRLLHLRQERSPPQAVKYLNEFLKEVAFEARSVHDKVYILPAGLDKGTAVERLRERISSGCVVCAGDSELDLPMLEIADMAVVPETLTPRREHMCVLPSRTFTSGMLGVIRETVSRPPPDVRRRRGS
jgi:hydroxymethylpyrimidine pyrophosphatase-like HAD family hydrolase